MPVQCARAFGSRQSSSGPWSCRNVDFASVRLRHWILLVSRALRIDLDTPLDGLHRHQIVASTSGITGRWRPLLRVPHAGLVTSFEAPDPCAV